jgi:hypothetical protein
MPINQFLCRFIFSIAVTLFCLATPAWATSETTTRAPTVLVVNQVSATYPTASANRELLVKMLLRHFTSNTRQVAASQYTAGLMSRFDYTVILGNDALAQLPTALIKDLDHYQHPVMWLGYQFNRVPASSRKFGFAVTDCPDEAHPQTVEYKNKQYLVSIDGYCNIQLVSQKTKVIATFGNHGKTIPFILHGMNIWYVNWLPDLDSDYPSSGDAPFLILADVLHDFFGTNAPIYRNALIRFEDVNVLIDPKRLMQAVDYLYSQKVPFAMGVIPAQRLPNGQIIYLQQRPEVIKALRYAQAHGATIILHGYHHTFGTGEDYEFWDIKHNAPLKGETWQIYASKVEDGIRILRDQGLRPRFWETPHYAGSPLAYQVFAHYFSYAIENRDPISWLPYPSGPDQYGQFLIPETLGYINPSQGWTVKKQLTRAKMLQIVRDAWAVGFYHPVNIPVTELHKLVLGLRQQGYHFVDLRTFPTAVRDNYQPSILTRATVWLIVDSPLSWPIALLLGFACLILWLLRPRQHPWNRLASAGQEIKAMSEPSDT